LGHLGGRRRHTDAGFFESGNFGGSRSLAAADDGSGVTHTAARRSGRAGDESGHGLLAVGTNPIPAFFLGRAADFANENHAVSLRVRVEQLDDIEMGGAIDRVATDADTGGLADTAASKLPDGFVRKRAAAGDHADVAFLVNV